jgi:molecular chaperone DnaK
MRNTAEAQVHEVKKDLVDHGDKITDEQKAEIESVIAAVETAMKGEDADLIKAELEKVYPAMKALLDAKTAAEQPQAEQPAEDNVVDATFTETKKD